MHFGGYVPATYDEATVTSWKKGIENLNSSSKDWEKAKGSSIYEHIEEVGPPSLRSKLQNGILKAQMSKRIATIVCDLTLDVKLEDCKIRAVDRIKVVEVLKKYNFKSLIRRLGFEVNEGVIKEVKVEKEQLPLI